MTKREPNLRQRRTAEIMMENGGKMGPRGGGIEVAIRLWVWQYGFVIV